ncbi:MAG: FHA domain-containing protein [Candidatus Nanopelagicales bacterium]
MRTCTRCGQEVADLARFCSNCGAALADLGPDNPADVTGTLDAALTASGPLPAVGPGTLGGVDAGTAMLIVRRGPSEGTSFTLDSDRVTIGRADDSAVMLDDVTVSRRHAVCERTPSGWVLRDAGSLNGTYVNRQRIESSVLAGGDEVQIGKYRFVFLVGGGLG